MTQKQQYPGFVKGFKQQRSTYKKKKSSPIQFLSRPRTSFFGKILNSRKKWFNVPIAELPFVYFSMRFGYTQHITNNFDKIFLGHYDRLKDITGYLFARSRVGKGLREVFSSLLSIPRITPKEVRKQLSSELAEKRAATKTSTKYAAIPPPQESSLNFIRSKIQNREAFLLCEELLMYMFHEVNVGRYNSTPYINRTREFGTLQGLRLTPLHSLVYVKSWMIVEFGSVENALDVFLQYYKSFNLLEDLETAICHRLEQFGTILDPSRECRGYRFLVPLKNWLQDVISTSLQRSERGSEVSKP